MSLSFFQYWKSRETKLSRKIDILQRRITLRTFPVWILFLFWIGIVYSFPNPSSLFCFGRSSLNNLSNYSTCPNNGNSVNISYMNSQHFCMHLATNDIVSKTIAQHKLWAPQVTKLISLLLTQSTSKPAVLLDIGANVGWFTLVMSALGHNVIAIEPMGSNVKLLKESLEISRLSKYVTLYPHGLGLELDKCLIISDDNNVGDGHTMCGDIADREMSARVSYGYSVRQVLYLTRLDSLVRQDIDVLKIDVEGYELFAIQSGERLFERYEVRHIISKFSPDNIRGKGGDAFEYLRFFVNRGYKIRVTPEDVGDIYEKNNTKGMLIYKTEAELRKLAGQQTTSVLWMSRI